MTTFLTAIGLVLVIEGFVYGGIPSFAKQIAALLIEMPEETLRTAGLTSALAGVGLIWLAHAVL